ncbi:MAG: PKD domain-containing protein, partial [Bacteroidia bacterium]
ADFDLNNACMNSEATFTDKSATNSGLLTYTWNFGDGNSSTDQNPSNTYSQDGNFEIELVVNSENGCKDTIEKSIEIYPLPDAGFSFKHKGWGQYDFTPNNADLASYSWDFGDGANSTDVSPYHEFATEGSYNVTLNTTDDNTCSSDNTIEVSVSTGLEDDKSALTPLSVYPNPFTDVINITYELNNKSDVSIEVYTLSGKKIKSLVNQSQSNGKYQYQFSTPNPSGIYTIKMMVDGKVYHQRIVKTK